MGSRFMELLKNITIFLLAGQVILRFLPEGGYEKYARIIVGVMVLSQLALPLLSLGGFDARAVFSDTLLEYEQEMQRIEKQVEQAGLKEEGYVQDGLETALSDRLLDFCGEWGIRIVSAAVDEDGVLQLTVRDSEKSGKEEVPQTVSTEDYAHQLEESLLEIVRAITGEDDAQVMVTLESSSRQVYAQEEKKSAGNTQEQSDQSTIRSQSTDDQETSYILVKEADGSQKALAVTEISPEVRGVVVVCGNSENVELQQSIIDAVTTALQISSTRVCVVGKG